MTDLATLHKTARSLILNLREGLETLEKADEQAREDHVCAASRKEQCRVRAMHCRCQSMERPQALAETCSASLKTCRWAGWRLPGRAQALRIH